MSHDVTQPLPQLEAVFYRRNSDRANASFQYYNHILIGSQLLYIKQPLKKRDVSRFRMVLVQGTRYGRLDGICLHPKSDISPLVAPNGGGGSSGSTSASRIRPEKTAFPTRYIINVSGTDSWGIEQSWQLAFASKELSDTWLEALLKARHYIELSTNSGEHEELRTLALKMKAALGPRRRIYRFRMYVRTFPGIRAVKWIMRERQCTLSQAIAIGNKMICAGFFYHVLYEHLLCPKTLLYRFSEEIDPLAPSRFGKEVSGDVGGDDEGEESGSSSSSDDDQGDDDDENDTGDGLVLNPNNESKVVSALLTARRELKIAQTEVATTHRRNTYLVDEYGSLSTQYFAQLRSEKIIDWILFGLLFVDLLPKAASCCTFLNLSCHHDAGNDQECSAAATAAAGRDNATSSPQLYWLQLCSTLVLIAYNTFMKRGIVGILLYYVYGRTAVHKISITHAKKAAKRTAAVIDDIDTKVVMEEAEDDDDNDEEEDDEAGTPESNTYGAIDPTYRIPQEGDISSDANLFRIDMDDDYGDDDEIDDVFDTEIALYAAAAKIRQNSKSSKRRSSGNNSNNSNSKNDDERTMTPIRQGTTNQSNEEEEDCNFDGSGDQWGQDGDDPSTAAGGTTPLLRQLTTEDIQAVTAIGHPDTWPNNPILIRRSPQMLKAGVDEQNKNAFLQPLQIHLKGPRELSFLSIDSDLFQGKVHMVIANLPDSPRVPIMQRGVRRRNRLHMIVQGRFKKKIPFASVYTGQAFSESLRQLPDKLAFRAFLKLLTKTQPALRMNLTGDKPYILSPLVCTAQNMDISGPGKEPNLSTTTSVHENIAMLDPSFEKLSGRRRKSFFAKQQGRMMQKYHFDPELVYTFEFFQHSMNISRFQVDLGILKYDILRALGVRPMQIMLVEWDPIAEAGIAPDRWKFLYLFEVWHRRSIPADLLISSRTIGLQQQSPAVGSSTPPRAMARKKSWLNSISPLGKPKAAVVSSVGGGSTAHENHNSSSSKEEEEHKTK